VITLLLTKRDVIEILGRAPPPYTGRVEPDTDEHKTILALARRRKEASDGWVSDASGVQG
jgi:hypothetical protein